MVWVNAERCSKTQRVCKNKERYITVILPTCRVIQMYKMVKILREACRLLFSTSRGISGTVKSSQTWLINQAAVTFVYFQLTKVQLYHFWIYWTCFGQVWTWLRSGCCSIWLWDIVVMTQVLYVLSLSCLNKGIVDK